MFLGIEIGGSKLQLGIGPGDGTLAALWRGTVAGGADGEAIRRQITAAVPELLAKAGVESSRLRGAGVGFGGPVDDATRTVIRSHQIDGWDGFPLADWLGDLLGLPVALGNDADVAGLAEALFGAGRGVSPVFYVTIGSGIGGGLIINGEIYRGCGRGAAEIGHLVGCGHPNDTPLERLVSGWAIEEQARQLLHRGDGRDSIVLTFAGGQVDRLMAWHLGEAARRGDDFARFVLRRAWDTLAEALRHVIVLLCPRRIV